MASLPGTTPFEAGNGNQSSSWDDCIAFHQALAKRFPEWLRFDLIGTTENGTPIHAGVFSADGDFDPVRVRAAGRPVVLNNNGIHPGEPEGIDVCMALVRDLCHDPQARAALGRTVLVYVPVYNVDGARNRGDGSRVNQLGPEAFGFRGNARHLDLNRDFIKADSRNARAFAALFALWDPDVLFDTHTSNGADYQDTMTLIPTQPDKLGGELGPFLRERMVPALHAAMQASGWPMCPYVDTVAETPDDGIADFLDLPRFSTGYAALRQTIGFMPESHMLKPFADRVRAMRALLDALLAFVAQAGPALHALRMRDRAAFASAGREGRAQPLNWTLDRTRSTPLRFRGYAARHAPSRLGDYQRLWYDRSAPYVKTIAHYDRYLPADAVVPPLAYLVPQAWHEVLERLRLNGVPLRALAQSRSIEVEGYRVTDLVLRESSYEGRRPHARLGVRTEALRIDAQPGDWIVPLGEATDRYVFETLEPLGADSLFRWGFFDAVLDRKETYSAYVFEDEAERLLQQEPPLRAAFERWREAHPALLSDQRAVLDFIFTHCERYAEPAHRRVPVFRIVDPAQLPD